MTTLPLASSLDKNPGGRIAAASRIVPGTIY